VVKQRGGVKNPPTELFSKLKGGRGKAGFRGGSRTGKAEKKKHLGKKG